MIASEALTVAPPRFEYGRKRYSDTPEFTEWLNNMGDVGWELVATVNDMLIFKRQKVDD
jgi:hypothetical protein